jgi:hypothetical protein
MEQWEYGAEWIAALDEALAAAKAEGAREAVERIRPIAETIVDALRIRMPNHRGAADDQGFDEEWEAIETLRDILYEEAAR